jgi:MSHA biogenesis protein MshL
VKSLIKNLVFLPIICTALALLSACTLSEPHFGNADSAIDRALHGSITDNKSLAANAEKDKAMPASVRHALMPEINIPHTDTQNTATADNDGEQRFDIAVNNVPAKDFFMGLVKDTKHNITVSPQVIGNISLELKEVSVPQAMEAVRNLYGFEYERTSYGYQVFPRRLETKIFNVNYLNIGRTGQSQTSIGSGQITNTVQNTLTSSGVSTSQQTGSMPSGIVQTTSNSNFWDLLQQNLLAIVGSQDGRSVVVNPGAGSIIIKAYPNELRNVTQYLDGIQSIMQRQVIIEAKVLEVELYAKFQSGIDWKVLGLQQTSLPTKFTDLQPLGTFSMNASGHNGAFTSAISLISTQGNVNVLSSPRVSTINNQKAVIKVGSDRFFVTNISSNTNDSGGSSTTTSNSITLTPFFSGISLDVTPQIDEDEYVTIHIHPIVSKVTEDPRTFTTSGVENKDIPLAQSTARESDSIVRAKNGQVVVIGGLMENRRDSEEGSTPGVDRIPGIGGLFKNVEKMATKFELIILLRPIVVGSDNTAWQQRLHETANNFKNMRNAKGSSNYNIIPIKRKNH